MRQIALLLFWSLAASAQTAKPEVSPSIEGRVLNAVTGEPVGKASLMLIPADSSQSFSQSDWMRSYGATSDSAGKFTIRNIDPGKYRLKATRNGFVSQEYGARSSQRSGTVLDLGSSQQQKDIDLHLTPGGVITGRVLDEEGEPLGTVQIQLLHPHYVNGKKVLSMTKTAWTNDLGEYRWSGLAPGKYYIYVENFDELPPASAAREEYVPVYYPGATNIAGSIPLDVTAGAQVRVMEITLHKAPTATVKGRVLVELPDAHGTPEVALEAQAGHDKPAPGSTIVLVPKEKERLAIFEFYQQATADQNGRFTFKNVVPGEYKVYAWEDVESGAWMDPEFIKPLDDKGEAVKVEESAQASVQVTIIPADSEKDKPQ